MAFTKEQRTRYEMTRRATGLPAWMCWQFVRDFPGWGFAGKLARLAERCWEEYSDHPQAEQIRRERERDQENAGAEAPAEVLT